MEGEGEMEGFKSSELKLWMNDRRPLGDRNIKAAILNHSDVSALEKYSHPWNLSTYCHVTVY